MSKVETLWYISKTDRNSFTSDPEMAVTVRFRGQDVPVVAPGYVNSWAVTAHRRQLKLWEFLLDKMEKKFDADEENDGEMVSLLAREIEALHEALAILGYGNTEPETLKLIRAQALIRYDQE